MTPIALSPNDSRPVQAVSRVPDYEPPAVGGPPVLPPPPPVPARRRGLPRPVPPCPPAPPGPPGSAGGVPGFAAAFADAALRRVLEVLDRRRPAAQLRPLLAVGLLDSLPSWSAGPGGSARLCRVITQPIGADAAEVAAVYRRGGRIHAIACRVQRSGPHWQVVALHMG